VTDPKPSWAVPLSWQVTAKTLGGRREALIRWGDVHRCDLLPEDLQTSAISAGKEARGLGKLFCTGRAPLNPPLRELCAERNRGKFGREKYHKRLENIADKAGGQGTVAWVAPPPALQKSSKNARLYRFLLRTRFSYHAISCSCVISSDSGLGRTRICLYPRSRARDSA
jgi:hypothetical protein